MVFEFILPILPIDAKIAFPLRSSVRSAVKIAFSLLLS